jgi:sugar phosphate isomerase/epimerase
MIDHTNRAAHDLTSDDIVLGHFTLGRSYPMRERLAAASAAGVAGVGLFMVDLERQAAEGMTDDDLEQLLAEHELLLVDLDLINLAPRDPAIRARTDRFVARAAELADRFGYRYLQTISPAAEPDAAGFEETADELGRVADALAPYGVEVGLEYTGFTTISTASQAVEMVTACGRPNLGVCVDVWHHRRASDHESIVTVPASLVRCVQINDGPVTPVEPDYKTDCVRNRWAPGTGEMAVAGFMATLLAMGVDVPWTVEVCRGDDELTGGRGLGHVQRCVTATRAVLDQVKDSSG